MARNSELIEDFRAAGRVLALLADSVNVAILRVLSGGELRGPELAERLVHVSRTTQFERLNDLETMTVISRETLAQVPRQSVYRLTAAGAALLPAAAPLEDWLAAADPMPINLGEAEATAPLKALTGALNSTILRWLAEGDRSPTELERLVSDGGYLDLKRTLRALKRARLAEPASCNERRHPYELTGWARQAAAPIGAMMRWERDHVPALSSPPSALDVEALLLLAAPQLKPPVASSGDCAFVVDDLAAISVAVDSGRVTHCAPGLDDGLTNRAHGSAAGWRAAIVAGSLGALDLHGDIAFTGGMVRALCEALH